LVKRSAFATCSVKTAAEFMLATPNVIWTSYRIAVSGSSSNSFGIRDPGQA